MVRLAILFISPLVVDRFGRSLRLCYIEFDMEAILMVTGVKMPGIGGGF